MAKEKTPQANAEITETGAVQLEESALDDASGGLNFSKIEYASPTGLKLDEQALKLNPELGIDLRAHKLG